MDIGDHVFQTCFQYSTTLFMIILFYNKAEMFQQVQGRFSFKDTDHKAESDQSQTRKMDDEATGFGK